MLCFKQWIDDCFRWLLTDFEQVKKFVVILLTLNNPKKVSSYFADFKQAKKVSSYFADFEQIKKN